MKKLFLVIAVFYAVTIFSAFIGGGQRGALAQNVGINITGATPAATNMLEVKTSSAAASSVGVWAEHTGAVAGGTGYGLQAIKSGASLNNIAAYLSATGATNNYSLIVPPGGGFAGIGTLTPSNMLDVYGASGVYPARVGNPDGFLQFGPANAGWCHFETDRPRYYFNTGGTFDSGNIGSYDEDLSLQTSGTTRITALNSNGNVGIGLTNPAYNLEINGTFGFGDGTAGSYRSRTETKDDAGLMATQSGFFQTSVPAPAGDWPAGASGWWHLLDIRHSNPANNYAMQLAGSFFDQNLYFRKTNNNAAQAWLQVLTSANNGDWIQNQYGGAQSANYWISGEGRVGGWFRNSASGTGLYNETTTAGIYSPSGGLMSTYNGSNFRIEGTTLIGNQGSSSTYGALTVMGTKNGWSGINFKDASSTNYKTLMIHPSYSGIYNAADNNWDWYFNDRNGQISFIYDLDDNGYYLDANSNSQVSSIYANNWFRAQGQTGLYFQDYCGGWYMTDASWIRNYCSKPLYIYGNGSTSASFDNGNVGIGTTGPGYKLEIVVGTTGGARVISGRALDNWNDALGIFEIDASAAYLPSITFHWPGNYAPQVGMLNNGGVVAMNSVGSDGVPFYAQSFNAWSDINSKKDINALEKSDYDRCLNDIMQIRSIKFRYKNESGSSDKTEGLAYRKHQHIGVEAQSLPAEVYSELLNATSTGKSKDGMNFVGYGLGDMDGLLIGGIKAMNLNQIEIQKKLDEQNKAIGQLKEEIEKLKSGKY